MATILIIEDEPSILRQISLICEKRGHFQTLGATNGSEGLQMAHEQRPDLIICDIMMPGIDGFGVLEALRADPSFALVPFILLTARTDREAMRQCMERGADDYLVKPFSADELIAAIHARLRRQTAIADASTRSLQEARRKFMQMVSHELRTPLVSINMAVEILSMHHEHVNPEQLRELLDSVRSGSKRLSRLVEQMVYITHLESGALTPETVQEDGLPSQFWGLVTVAVDLARRFAYRHPDTVVRLDGRDEEALVLCDRTALKHALAELITNAISFSPPGTEVIVSQWQAGESVWLSIVDQGPGISPEELERVMAGFYQVRREHQEQQGMGVGLSLAQQIIRTHGGEVHVQSVIGKGTQVQVQIPIAPA
jgi:two-component system sensor histidine kinase/response regulator